MMASFVGMGLVGVGGMLLGLDSSIDPLTGTRILLSIFAAAVLGGLGSAPGAVLGAFLIGIAEELSVLVVGSPIARRSASSPSWCCRSARAGCWGEGVLTEAASRSLGARTPVRSVMRSADLQSARVMMRTEVAP